MIASCHLGWCSIFKEKSWIIMRNKLDGCLFYSTTGIKKENWCCGNLLWLDPYSLPLQENSNLILGIRWWNHIWKKKYIILRLSPINYWPLLRIIVSLKVFLILKPSNSIIKKSIRKINLLINLSLYTSETVKYANHLSQWHRGKSEEYTCWWWAYFKLLDYKQGNGKETPCH